MNNKKTQKLIAAALMVTILGTFTHCLSNAPTGGGSTGSLKRNPGSTVVAPPEVPKAPEQIINQTQVEIGIKNHEQILHTFSVLTGVDPMNASIQQVYGQVSTGMPTTNDVKTFLAANQVAVTRLAAEFCTLLVDTASMKRSEIWPAFNFDTLTLANFNQAQQVFILDNMLVAFWGEGMISEEEHDEAVEDLLALMADLSVGEANTAASTRKVIKGACTSALSSAYVTLL